MGVRNPSEIPRSTTYRPVTYIVEEKQEGKGWVVLCKTGDAVEALQHMRDAAKQNPARDYRTLSQEVFARKEAIQDGEHRPTPRAEEDDGTNQDSEDKPAAGGG